METKVKLVWAELFSKQVPKELGLKYFFTKNLFVSEPERTANPAQNFLLERS